jgi:hypothetical protein
VGLRRRREWFGDPDVELVIAAREPDPAAPAKRLRLGQLGEPEELAIEPPGIGLGAGRRRDLDVVESDRSRGRVSHPSIMAGRYFLGMTDEHKTEELKVIQTEREAEERKLAESARDEDELEQHARRADKARYLREKLEERAESERRLKE